ncbi:hypothetical protein [Streptomyces sp. NPDC059639]|uniref:hypothetical protein n=1 Tax=Streptomyces sp. NPDC059639 TaxID=3346891 RepID=UPI0036C9ED3F
MRRLRWAAGALAVLFTLPLFVGGGPVSYAAVAPGRPAAPISYAAEPSPHGSLAGSRAGEGRTPPGRELPAPDESETAAPPPASEPAATPEPRETERPSAARQSVVQRGLGGPLADVLPLGAGLLLTGLGLGFLALRLRR